jgi:enterochelin esterase-like enzyme
MHDRHLRIRLLTVVFVLLCTVLAAAQAVPAPQRTPGAMKFSVTFLASLHAQPITGRVFVFVSQHEAPEPRIRAGNWMQQEQFLGTDVSEWRAGEPASIDGETLGYPLQSLADLPAGDYYVQALVNIYTKFHRSDGHTIWAHMDQWEGQQFNLSPGNLYSEVKKVHLDPSAGYNINLELTNVIPPVVVLPDTQYVKHIRIESELLSKFWGHPIYLGATILLPRGYDSHPGVHYPIIYTQDHFTLDAPFGFSSEPINGEGEWGRRMQQFQQQWTATTKFPRFIAVNFQHPTPYFDDSYAVNSANNGPYGDAIMQELIPYIEEHFRVIRKPYARVLWGGSTGGWESLALQLYHPDFFGGTWTFFPDPIDFTRYQLINIYKDESAFFAPGFEYVPRERPLMRTSEGQVVETMRQMSQLESVLGSHGRSGQQLEAWEAVYGPVGEDGYPKPLWDKQTGKIDPDVALYMRDHGYDLRYYVQQNWSKIGPQLVGKLHIYCGDMDNYYLNLAVYRMQDFLKQTKNPHYEGTFQYGRPMKGHGWMPMSFVQLVRMMAKQVSQNSPDQQQVAEWNY